MLGAVGRADSVTPSPHLPQRQKSAYAVYPKAEPTPVASSAPPASSLYSSPVVSPPRCSVTPARVASCGRAREGTPERMVLHHVAGPPQLSARWSGVPF